MSCRESTVDASLGAGCQGLVVVTLTCDQPGCDAEDDAVQGSRAAAQEQLMQAGWRLRDAKHLCPRCASAGNNALTFTLPLLPPSVNHYIDHGRGHRLTAPAKAWRDSFLAMLPASARGAFVTGERFAASIRIVPGPGQRGDIDNYSKLILDCIAKAGMLRNPHGAELSDAHFKELRLRIDDRPADRARGPLLEVTLEAL